MHFIKGKIIEELRKIYHKMNDMAIINAV